MITIVLFCALSSKPADLPPRQPQMPIMITNKEGLIGKEIIIEEIEDDKIDPPSLGKPDDFPAKRKKVILGQNYNRRGIRNH